MTSWTDCSAGISVSTLGPLGSATFTIELRRGDISSSRLNLGMLHKRIQGGE